MENTVLKITYGDAHLGVRGAHFEYLFSYQSGGPVSLVKDGKEWLYRAIRPALWRALTDNDRGNGFHLRSGIWLAADTFIAASSVRVAVDGTEIALPIAPENNRYTGNETADTIKITYVFDAITTPSAQITVSYTVYPDGHILVNAYFAGKAGLPELPCFGLRLIAPTKAKGFRYEGLSGETYPDRIAGGEKGIYEEKGLSIPAYLVPQECGMHMETEWVEICRRTTQNNADPDEEDYFLRVEKADRPFAFSCIPYTPEELENATHREELPAARRTVLTVYGAVRGIGGINSWGADVEEPYHISAEKDIEFSFIIR